MADNALSVGWEQHDHPTMVHAHRHWHVTHNHNEYTGGFEHLSSVHDHEHDHATVSHTRTRRT